MGNGSGVSRGDRNRNARLERLRALVPVTNAIAGIPACRPTREP
jgi:transposase